MLGTRKKFDDLNRTRDISRALQSLDESSFLFREAYNLGYPKFTDAVQVAGVPMTAFVGVNDKGEFVFCWGRHFFDLLQDDSKWTNGSTASGRVAFVLAHESLHVMLRHITRASGKDTLIWNYAADIVSNHYCKWYGLEPLPGSITKELYPVEWGIDPETQTTEQIYEILVSHADVAGCSGSGDKPGFSPPSGHHDQWPTIDEETRKTLDSSISEAQCRAADKDRTSGNNGNRFGCGKLPGDGAMGELRQVSDNLYAEHSVPWDALLRRRLGSMYQAVPQERWDRLPARLSGLWGKIVLPSQRIGMCKTGIHILIALDASASMTMEDLDRMRAIHKSLPEQYKTTIASFDTKCYIIESLDAVRGGGGTSLVDVNRVAEEIEADCVICLTDGYFGGSGRSLSRPEDWIFVIDGTSAYVPSESVCLLV